MTVKAAEEPGGNGKEMTIQELQELTNSFDTKTDKIPVASKTFFHSLLIKLKYNLEVNLFSD